MKVHLIKQQSIEDYVFKNPVSRSSFKDWLLKIKHADWKDTHDIKTTFKSVDFIKNNRVIFNIAHNSFRMICAYRFGHKQAHLYICWIGTHAEYDKINKQKLQYTINIF